MDIGYVILCLNFIYTLIITFIFFTKKRVKNIETKIFGSLVISNLLGLILEFFCGFFIKKLPRYKVLNFVFNKLHIINICFWITAFTIYVFSICIGIDKVKNKFKKIKLSLLVCIYLILLALICFILPIKYFNNGTYIYSYGMATDLIVLLGFIYLIIDILVITMNIKKLPKLKLLPLFILIAGLIIVLIIRNINPGIMLITTVFSIVTVLMYNTIENPDMKMIEQLEVAKDAADKANAAKTDFLSNMSHEIRTPLNAIVGFSDEIEQANTLDEAKENAKDIINASNTLLEIVNGILDISKIEAGKLEIVNTDYNANELFTGLAKLVTPKMNEKALDFQVSIAEDLPKVLYGDPANLRKVVTNLLSNAYKYTDSGFVKYVVSCVNKDNICSLVISVEDSGRGMKPENVDKLFTKFQRLDEDRNTTIEGTGLGLALTKQLVELMGGKIVVHTVYGQGSKFTVMISQRIDNVEISQVADVPDNLDLTNRRLLVVDDNPLNLKVATKLLQRYNATVDCCDSGYACISKFDNGEKYDLVLLDDMMPKMSGVETLHKLKEKGGFNTPVIALTANAITGMREKYIQDGFTDYLAKPIEKTEMIKIFNNILGSTSPVTSSEYIKPVESNGISLDRSFLEANNIDVNHGLELLGDMDLYNDTMGEFIKEMDKRLPKLKEYKENSDMPNYAILVHAIKSDCKYLGIMALADVCYEHELKSKASDVDFVNSNFDKLMDDINDYVIICKKYLGKE